jgi:hypothetical protein
MLVPDCSDPGKAARAFYIAARLAAEIAMMSAANDLRRAQDYAQAYGSEAFQAAIDDAERAVAAREDGEA